MNSIIRKVKDTKSLRRNVLGVLNFAKAKKRKINAKNPKEKNAEQKNTNQTHFKYHINNPHLTANFSKINKRYLYFEPTLPLFRTYF